MLGLAAWRLTRCPGCGGNLAETTDPDNEHRYVGDAVRCHQCTARATAAIPYQGPDVTAPQAILYTARQRQRR